MAATYDDWMAAIKEAKRFIEKAQIAAHRVKQETYFSGSKETAAAKRASMDLSNALVKVRK